ncbi:MAG: PilZ domain-containing protein, partial [Nitrospirota bacterium]
RLTRSGTIGSGGIMLYLPRAIPTGTAIALKLHLPGHHIIDCLARVVWTELLTGQERTEFKAGVQFEQIAQEALERLRRFVKEQQNPFDESAMLLRDSFHEDSSD